MTQEMKEAPLSGAIQNLFGAGDENVRLLEQLLDVRIALRGGEITVEGGSEQAASRWIVDPIDGTSNFYKGEKLYTISIAYEQNSEMVAGCVFCPPTNELFLGVKGEGATLNGSPIHVSEEAVTRNAYLHMSFCHRSKENNARVIRLLPEICQSFSDLRRSGSAA